MYNARWMSILCLCMECMFIISCYYSCRDEPTFKVVPKIEDSNADDIYTSDKPKEPYFTKQPSTMGVKEGHPVRFECTLMPVGDPNMSVEWYCNGQLVKVGEFIFVLRSISWEIFSA